LTLVKNVSDFRCEGITLNRVIEGGLDNGWIVLVPDKPKKGEDTVWRCVLVNHSIASDMVIPGTKWKVCLVFPLTIFY
jgi:hypothetical protein